jgi:type III secretion system FlhB-like substrate exporter
MSRLEEVLDSGGGPGGKRAVSVRYGPDGEMEIVGIAEGAEAEAMIARARSHGVEVREDAEQVNDLFRSGQASSRVPPEVYELMSLMVQFAEEVNEAWAGSGPDCKG